MMYGEAYKIWSSSLYMYPPSPVTSCLLGANILHTTLKSSSSLNERLCSKVLVLMLDIFSTDSRSSIMECHFRCKPSLEVPVSEVIVKKQPFHFENNPIRQIILNQVSKQHLRYNFFKVFKDADLQVMFVFWVLTPRSVFRLLQRFKRTYYLHLQGDWIWFRLMMKCWRIHPNLKLSVNLKTVIAILRNVRIWHTWRCKDLTKTTTWIAQILTL